jgi:hypothetical protein
MWVVNLAHIVLRIVATMCTVWPANPHLWSTVAVAGWVGCRRFEFAFSGSPQDVGMASGATIHTANGLKCKVTRRKPGNQQKSHLQPATQQKSSVPDKTLTASA